MNMRITALPLVYFAFSALLLSSYGQDNTGGLYPVTQNGKWGYIDDERIGYIDKSGRYIWAPTK